MTFSRVLLLSVCSLLMASFLCVPRAEAKLSTYQAHRIDRLIAYIQVSDAVFYRNGEAYSAEKAASHLRWKLTFAGDQLETAEQFIDYVAAGSVESGKAYYVKFDDGDAMPTKQWLHDHLRAMDATLASL